MEHHTASTSPIPFSTNLARQTPKHAQSAPRHSTRGPEFCGRRERHDPHSSGFKPRRWCRKVGGNLENWRKLLIVKHSERRCAAAERSLRHGTCYSIDAPQHVLASMLLFINQWEIMFPVFFFLVHQANGLRLQRRRLLLPQNQSRLPRNSRMNRKNYRGIGLARKRLRDSTRPLGRRPGLTTKAEIAELIPQHAAASDRDRRISAGSSRAGGRMEPRIPPPQEKIPPCRWLRSRSIEL